MNDLYVARVFRLISAFGKDFFSIHLRLQDEKGERFSHSLDVVWQSECDFRAPSSVHI